MRFVPVEPRQTDKDLRYFHRSTGTAGRIEIKQMTGASQRRDLPRLKRQLQQMAWEQRTSGELQAFVNRREVIPELKEHAKRLGIPVYENVVTGDAAAARRGATRIETVMDRESRRHRRLASTRALSGAGSAAFGGVLVYRILPEANRDWERLRGSEATAEDWIRAGRSTALVVSGGSALVGGSATVISAGVQSVEKLRWLKTTARVGGGIAVAAFLVSEGFVLWQYRSGLISTREFAASEAGLF